MCLTHRAWLAKSYPLLRQDASPAARFTSCLCKHVYFLSPMTYILCSLVTVRRPLANFQSSRSISNEKRPDLKGSPTHNYFKMFLVIIHSACSRTRCPLLAASFMGITGYHPFLLQGTYGSISVTIHIHHKALARMATPLPHHPYPPHNVSYPPQSVRCTHYRVPWWLSSQTFCRTWTLS